MTLNILGTDYEIIDQTEKENPKVEGADGICEIYAKQIIIDTSHKDDRFNFTNIEAYYHKVLRHEAFHALFAEMGMSDWFKDETLVDMLAMQYPKIREIMDKCDSVDIFNLKN